MSCDMGRQRRLVKGPCGAVLPEGLREGCAGGTIFREFAATFLGACQGGRSPSSGSHWCCWSGTIEPGGGWRAAPFFCVREGLVNGTSQNISPEAGARRLLLPLL